METQGIYEPANKGGKIICQTYGQSEASIFYFKYYKYVTSTVFQWTLFHKLSPSFVQWSQSFLKYILKGCKGSQSLK